MSKQIRMTPRPAKNPQADSWVEASSASAIPIPVPQGETKRLTFDIDKNLHRRLRLHSVKVDTPVNVLMIPLIEALVKSGE